ncbi:MAG: tetratricopeptide repeat protein [Elusimicrobiota bacterium]|nr:tetratricopeptide repeat protein [Elusimicrobiota bacterium]
MSGMPGRSPWRSSLLDKAALASAFLVWVFFLANRGEDLDTWFHLGVGRWIVEHRAVPALDPFSFTAAANPYVDSHWLFQVVLYAVHALGGILLITALQGACFLGGILILSRSAPTTGLDSLKAAAFIALAPVVADRILLRPDMATFLFMAVFWRALFSHQAPSRRWLWSLPFVQVLWVNMHGLFMFGPVLAGAALAGGLSKAFLPLPDAWKTAEERGASWKELALLFVAVCAACVVTPYGAAGVKYAYLLYTEIGHGADSFMRSVSELKSTGAVYQLSPPVLMYRLIVAGTVLSALLNRRRLSLSAAATILAFGHLAGQSVRNTAYFSFLAVPFMLRNFAEALPNGLSIALPAFRTVSIAAAAILGFFLASGRYYVHTRDNKSFGIGRNPFTQPDGAMDFVEKSGLKGRQLNDILFGGFMIWRWHPQRPVFVDGRLEVYGPAFLEEYRRMTEAPTALWDELTRRWDIQFAVLSGISPYSEHVVEYLGGRKDWPLLFSDGFSAVYARRDGVNKEAVARVLAARKNLFDAEPVPVRAPGLRVHFPLEALTRAKFAVLAGDLAAARAEYERILAVRPDDLESLRSLAAVESRSGRSAEAIALLQRALATAPQDAPTASTLGIMLTSAGRLDEAAPLLEKAVRLQPDLAQAHAALGALRYRKGDIAGAAAALEKALSFAPNDPVAHFNLGACRLKMDRRDDAIASFRHALSLKPDYAEAKAVLASLGTR